MLGAAAMFLTGAAIYYAVRDPKYLKNFEEKFVDKYRLRPTVKVPLTFDEVDRSYLLNLCKNYVSEKKLNENPPSVQTHWLGFKLVPGHIIKMELIRCTNKLAIIQSDEYYCAYLLKKAKESLKFKSKKKGKEFLGTIFRIKAKFCFGKELIEEKVARERELRKMNESPRDNELMFEHDYSGIPAVGRMHDFSVQGAGHEMNHNFAYAPPTPLTHDESVMLSQDGRPIVYHPGMQNQDMRSINQPPQYDGNSRVRHPAHVSQRARSERRTQELGPHFETYRRSSDPNNHPNDNLQRMS